jgi:hypothetical protein
MQVGYVLCSPSLQKVLRLNQDKNGVELVPIESTIDLNKCICLSDLTEIKNIYKRFVDSGLAKGLEIVNVARLYKRFY